MAVKGAFWEIKALRVSLIALSLFRNQFMYWYSIKKMQTPNVITQNWLHRQLHSFTTITINCITFEKQQNWILGFENKRKSINPGSNTEYVWGLLSVNYVHIVQLLITELIRDSATMNMEANLILRSITWRSNTYPCTPAWSGSLELNVFKGLSFKEDIYSLCCVANTSCCKCVQHWARHAGNVHWNHWHQPSAEGIQVRSNVMCLVQSES